MLCGGRLPVASRLYRTRARRCSTREDEVLVFIYTDNTVYIQCIYKYCGAQLTRKEKAPREAREAHRQKSAICWPYFELKTRKYRG